MKKSYKELKEFTLVEMLVVMSILMVLMTVGIAGGRYAIQRSNDIAHQDAVTKLNEALVAFYADKRIYPAHKDDCKGASTFDIKTLVDTCLKDYLDGAFSGGSTASYYYLVSGQKQSAIICVSLGGQEDTDHRGIYCAGNGIGDSSMAKTLGTSITVARNEYSDQETAYKKLVSINADTTFAKGTGVKLVKQWNGSDWASI